MQGNAERVLFQIQDTGIGLSPAKIENLFQPFTQVDASMTRKYSGTGLGLAITQRFCHMLGGDLTVESRLDQGSTFTIRLPVATTASSGQEAARLVRAHELGRVCTLAPPSENAISTVDA